MPFGVWTHVTWRNLVLDRGPDPPREWAIKRRGNSGPFVKYRDSLLWAVQNSCTNRDAVRGAKFGGSRESHIWWGAHWRHLVNTTKHVQWQYGLMSNYSDHLLYSEMIIKDVKVWVWRNGTCQVMTNGKQKLRTYFGLTSTANRLFQFEQQGPITTISMTSKHTALFTTW